MKKKIAEKIVRMAEKSAYKSVGKSFPWGVHEIRPPEELLKGKREEKNGSVFIASVRFFMELQNYKRLCKIIRLIYIISI